MKILRVATDFHGDFIKSLNWFLDRVATYILALEGDSTVDWFEGNYQAFHEHRRELLGDAADRPRRIRFHPVSHQ